MPEGSRAGKALRVVVLADTHLQSGPRRGRAAPPGLPAAVSDHLQGADVILHAGDVLDQGVLDQLAEWAPLYAVLGNNDRSLVGTLPLTRMVELDGVRIGLIHDSGPSTGRVRRLRRRFPDADVVVFGHSHAPVNEPGEDGQLLFNPGSPTQRRAQPTHSIGELRVARGRLVGHRIIMVDRPAPTHR